MRLNVDLYLPYPGYENIGDFSLDSLVPGVGAILDKESGTERQDPAPMRHHRQCLEHFGSSRYPNSNEKIAAGVNLTSNSSIHISQLAACNRKHTIYSVLSSIPPLPSSMSTSSLSSSFYPRSKSLLTLISSAIDCSTNSTIPSSAILWPFFTTF